MTELSSTVPRTHLRSTGALFIVLPNDGELYRGPCCLDHAVGLHVCEDVGGLAADGDDVVTGVKVALCRTARCNLEMIVGVRISNMKMEYGNDEVTGVEVALSWTLKRMF